MVNLRFKMRWKPILISFAECPHFLFLVFNMAFSPDKQVITGDKPYEAFLKLLFSSKQIVRVFAILWENGLKN